MGISLPEYLKNSKGAMPMSLNRALTQLSIRLCLWLAVLALMFSPVVAAAPHQGTTLGPEDESKEISVTVWLNLHNKAALDSLVQQMYDKNSPNYHHWLTIDQYKTQFAPTAEEAALVRDFLASHNMKVSMIDQNNHFVLAQTRVGDAQKAFNVQINRVMFNGVVHHVSSSEAKLAGPAASLVAAVQGLSDLEYSTNVSLAANPATRQAYPGVSTSSAGADGLFFSGQCLFPPQSVNFNTAGTFPSASYFGNRYGAPITNTTAPTLPPCGYDAAQLQTAYGLTPLYSKGLTGAGQTIVIVDAFGSNTIVQDANAFSQLNSLPLLTSSNFQIIDSAGPGTATCTATNGCIAGNWQFETSLDVEWAHAMAPGANIILVLGPNSRLASLDAANLFAVENGLGNVLSNSFGTTEIRLVDLNPGELVVENNISELAASLGISQHVSSGDSGDNLALDNAAFGINSVSVNANADSPFVTSIGGTSTFLDSHSKIELQTGWGNNATAIAFGATAPPPPLVPPVPLGFLEGAGGGTSVVYAKPAFQNRLPGQFRLVPDISMDADPQTGVEVILTPDGNLADGTFVFVVGGTSLSAPMFSGVWAIADQQNAAIGGGSLGQAAPLLYELSGGAITDVNVNPFETLLDVSGFILNPPTAPFTFETAPALAQPLENTKFFLSALFQPASNEWVVLTFGTDSSLFTAPGWDNVTGLGTPNGERFIDQVVEVAHHH
jgi:subtilase family serine protease